MQILPATLIASLLTIVSHGTAYPANSDDDTPYVIQQEHAAPVTVTDLLGSDRFAPGVENAHDLKGAELQPTHTAAQATSIDDRQQASEGYAERRQRMIEQCEQNNGIDCAREVDTALRAQAIPRHQVLHTMRPAGGSR
jgi:hypothetical protein